MVVRLSEKTATGYLYHDSWSWNWLKYNVGGVCLFQGPGITGPNDQQTAGSQNTHPDVYRWGVGLGMRYDSILPLPRQMMLGAMQDPRIMYQYGKIVGNQCKRAGIQVNYAPVMDVNNNPDNPVINDRSFGKINTKWPSMAFNI